MSESLIEKLAEISIRVFTIGRAIGDKDLEKLSAELNSLSADISKKDWHTGKPIEKGIYVVLTKYYTAKGVPSEGGTYIIDFWNGYAFIKLREMYSLKDMDKWIAWQKIEPYRG